METKELKDGVFYKVIGDGLEDCIMKYNKSNEYESKGYWRGEWGDGCWSFPPSFVVREATLEELNALGDEHLPYSKYLQEDDICWDAEPNDVPSTQTELKVGDMTNKGLIVGIKDGNRNYLVYNEHTGSHSGGGFILKNSIFNEKIHGDKCWWYYKEELKLANHIYTLNDLTKGRVAVINDGISEELFKVLKFAFPKDSICTSVTLETFDKIFNVCKYYFMDDNEEQWDYSNYTELPTQSVKVFLNELERYEFKNTVDELSITTGLKEIYQYPPAGSVITIRVDENGNLEYLNENPMTPEQLQQFLNKERLVHTNEDVLKKSINLSQCFDTDPVKNKQLRRFKSGAVRSDDRGRLRPDYISPYALEEIAEHFTQAAKEFGADDFATNYFKGIEPKDVKGSISRHYIDLQKAFAEKDDVKVREELRAMACNCIMALHQIRISELGLYVEEFDKTEYITKD